MFLRTCRCVLATVQFAHDRTLESRQHFAPAPFDKTINVVPTQDVS
jgi:hypothetical protein